MFKILKNWLWNIDITVINYKNHFVFDFKIGAIAMDGVFRRRLGTMILLILINAGLFAIPAQIIYENVKELIVDELKKMQLIQL